MPSMKLINVRASSSWNLTRMKIWEIQKEMKQLQPVQLLIYWISTKLQHLLDQKVTYVVLQLWLQLPKTKLWFPMGKSRIFENKVKSSVYIEFLPPWLLLNKGLVLKPSTISSGTLTVLVLEKFGLQEIWSLQENTI